MEPRCKYVKNRRERKDLANEAMKPVFNNHLPRNREGTEKVEGVGREWGVVRAVPGGEALPTPASGSFCGAGGPGEGRGLAFCLRESARKLQREAPLRISTPPRGLLSRKM